jgi:hypothetical protein
MRRSLVFLAMMLSISFLRGQTAMTFDAAKESALRVSQLDSIYKSGIHADSMQAVFKNNQDEYIAAYQKLLQDLGKHLKANNFTWNQPVKGFNRIYFDKDGRIDYFLYSFRPGQLSAEQEKAFDALLNGFIKTYRFPLNAEVKFAQCRPVTYMPAETKTPGK